MQAFLILGGIVSQLASAALPVLSRSAARGDARSDYFVDVVFRSGLLLGGLLSMVALTVGPTVIQYILGADYDQVAVLLPLSLLVLAPYFIQSNVGSVIVAFGDYNVAVRAHILGAIVFSLVILPAYNHYAALGIMLAMGVGLFSVTLTQVYFLRSYSYASVSIGRSILRPLVAVICSYGLCYIFADYWNPWVLLLLGFLTLLLSMGLLGVVRKEELHHVKIYCANIFG